MAIEDEYAALIQRFETMENCDVVSFKTDKTVNQLGQAFRRSAIQDARFRKSKVGRNMFMCKKEWPHLVFKKREVKKPVPEEAF